MDIHSASIQIFHRDTNTRKTLQLFSFVLNSSKKVCIIIF